MSDPRLKLSNFLFKQMTETRCSIFFVFLYSSLFYTKHFSFLLYSHSSITFSLPYPSLFYSLQSSILFVLLYSPYCQSITIRQHVEIHPKLKAHLSFFQSALLTWATAFTILIANILQTPAISWA